MTHVPSRAAGELSRLWRAARKPLVALGLVVGLLLAWGVGIEPRLLDERFEVAAVPRLPAAWDGQRVAFFADLQLGMWLANTDTVRRAVGRVVAGAPAAVLVGGDFLYHPTEEAGEPREAHDELEREDLRELGVQVEESLSVIAPLLEAGLPTVAVLGNHDYAMERPDSLALPPAANLLARRLRAAGVTVLRNDAVPLGRQDENLPAGDRLYLGGLDAWFPNRTDVRAMLDRIPRGAPRLILTHNPSSFRRLPPGSAPVALAGHTHGGQIRIPFLPHWSWMSLVESSPMATDGWAAPGFGAPGNRLYVNRGIGFSIAPVRINCRPELTWFTLRRAGG